MWKSVVVLAALYFQQSTPSGGPIMKYVPPVPTPASFISDQRNVIGPAAHASLDARITAIQRAGLGDIAVAILPSIGDYSPNQVAVEIYRTWRVGSVAAIGSAHRNVGALILIVPRELAPNHRGECWINTGTGSEGILTDNTVATICRDSIIPHLRNRDYAGALTAGIGALESRLRGDAGLATPARAAELPEQRKKADDSPNSLPAGLIAIGGLFIILGALYLARRYRRRKCPRCGKSMRRLDEKADDAELDAGEVIEEQIGSVDYDVWVCDCGGELIVPYKSFFTRYTECRKCHRRTVSATRRIIVPASTISSGEAEDTYACKACGATWMDRVVLPMIVVSSSSSSGSSSSGGGGGGGGGGGSSFGGSGSTSGGGGGGSY